MMVGILSSMHVKSDGARMALEFVTSGGAAIVYATCAELRGVAKSILQVVGDSPTKADLLVKCRHAREAVVRGEPVMRAALRHDIDPDIFSRWLARVAQLTGSSQS